LGRRRGNAPDNGILFQGQPGDLEKLIVMLNNKGQQPGDKAEQVHQQGAENALRMADKLSFPIIQIPLPMMYLEIITPVLSDIINDQARKLEYSEKIHNSFTQLIIRGGGPQRIVNTLGDILGADVAFYDAYYDRKYLKSDSEKFSRDVGFMPVEDIMKAYYSYQIYLDRKDNGYLIISTAS
jgi:purine catabolism regulator